MLCCGAFKLIYDVQQEALWAAANEGKKQASSFEMRGPTELFGFGSGDFCEGPDAKDVQSDLTGRWVSFSISSSDDHCILEPDRRLPEHIRKLDVFGKVPGRKRYNINLYGFVLSFFHFLWFLAP